MKPFQSFYGAKQFDRSMNDVERLRIEKGLKRTLEEKIKEVRNNLMEQTNFKSSPQLNKIMTDYMNFIEDCEAGRLAEEQQ
jgi:hypothetical protein